jgi:hypothetical protein
VLIFPEGKLLGLSNSIPMNETVPKSLLGFSFSLQEIPERIKNRIKQFE